MHCGVPSNEQTCVENSDIHIKDNLKDINTTSSLADIPQNQQQLEFVQAAPDSPVTNEKVILYRIKTRLNHDFDIIGEDAVLTIVQKVLGHDC